MFRVKKNYTFAPAKKKNTITFFYKLKKNKIL